MRLVVVVYSPPRGSTSHYHACEVAVVSSGKAVCRTETDPYLGHRCSSYHTLRKAISPSFVSSAEVWEARNPARTYPTVAPSVEAEAPVFLPPRASRLTTHERYCPKEALWI